MSNQVEELKEEIKKQDEGELITIQKPITCEKGNHQFKQVKKDAVECVKCPVGYNIPVTAEVKNGHLYINNQLLV